MHLDLHPQVILADSKGRFFLSGFGLSRYLTTDEDPIDTPIGTEKYFAPEMTTKKVIGGFTDIHNLGLILYELCAIHDFTDSRFKFITSRDPADFNIHPTYSDELSRWIKEMCYPDCYGRPTAAEILSADWLRNVN